MFYGLDRVTTRMNAAMQCEAACVGISVTDLDVSMINCRDHEMLSYYKTRPWAERKEWRSYICRGSLIPHAETREREPQL